MTDTKNFRYYAGGLELEIRPVFDADYVLIHRWRTDPRASFWGSTSVTKTEVRDRYEKLNPGETARMLSVVRPSGRIIPVGFLLFYCPDRSEICPMLDYDPYHDALAQQYVSDPDDGGCHILFHAAGRTLICELPKLLPDQPR